MYRGRSHLEPIAGATERYPRHLDPGLRTKSLLPANDNSKTLDPNALPRAIDTADSYRSLQWSTFYGMAGAPKHCRNTVCRVIGVNTHDGNIDSAMRTTY